nr:MAG TPA: hypothetical protein [Caudoviricetes sp.]
MTVRSLIPFIKHNDIRLVLEDDSEICLIRKEHIQKELLSDKCLDMKVVYIETDEEIPDTISVYVAKKNVKIYSDGKQIEEEW